jgi:prepilin-type N-terminal cleavage/methylation domain-containing protein
MHAKDSRGFTIVEIITALALLAVLTVIAWGKFNTSFDKALRATMISDLRNLAAAQEIYYREHQTYTDDLSLLSITPSAKSRITISEAARTGWAAWAEIERATEKCELHVGSTASSPLGLTEDPERIVCGVP